MSDSIADEKVVSIHYTLRNDGGEVLDSSSGAEPLTYLHGFGNIIPGLERHLVGKSAGDEFEVKVPPAEGYGEREGPGPQPVPRSAFGDAEVEPGMSIVVEESPGKEIPLWVVAVEDEQVFVDANHPLAGETLHFAVEVVSVRAATPEEIAHGHVHDGHHHH